MTIEGQTPVESPLVGPRQRARVKGAELVGEVYEDQYRLCYMRDPTNIIFTLAEELR